MSVALTSRQQAIAQFCDDATNLSVLISDVMILTSAIVYGSNPERRTTAKVMMLCGVVLAHLPDIYRDVKKNVYFK